MKGQEDEVLSISNPRMISAIYFSALAIIASIIIDTVLYVLGVRQLLPIHQSIFLAVVVAAVFGALFGKKIVHSPRPYWKHTFWSAFLMVLLALPFYNLGFIYLFQQHHDAVFSGASFKHLFYLYWITLVYSFILAGAWLALLAGLAAVYLRARLVHYLLLALYQRRKKPKEWQK